MYINATGYYVPATRVPNEHFLELNGLTSEWITQRTGIRSRSKVGEGEGHNSMGTSKTPKQSTHLQLARHL